MTKNEALSLVENNRARLAEIVGVTPQAVCGWPDVLPQRISDRVLGAMVRNGVHVPAAWLCRTTAPDQPHA